MEKSRDRELEPHTVYAVMHARIICCVAPCIYIYIYICIYIYIYVCVCVRVYRPYVYMHICIHVTMFALPLASVLRCHFPHVLFYMFVVVAVYRLYALLMGRTVC